MKTFMATCEQNGLYARKYGLPMKYRQFTVQAPTTLAAVQQAKARIKAEGWGKYVKIVEC